jgi:hypothetical protein
VRGRQGDVRRRGVGLGDALLRGEADGSVRVDNVGAVRRRGRVVLLDLVKSLPADVSYVAQWGLQ